MPSLSVVIPCYNEVHTVEAIIAAVRASPVEDKEIIVVDDFSTDGTRDRLRSLPVTEDLQVFYHEVNRGKGAALRTGFAQASGDIVIGSRFAGGQSHRVLYFWHYLANKMLTLCSNTFTNLNLTDMETCFKAFRRSILQVIDLKEERFGFEPEVTAKVARMGCRIYEVGISYSGRTYAEGKKIGWRDGLRAIWCIVRYNVLD